MSLFCIIFKASALWADASISRIVRLRVRVSVCLCVFTLRYRLNVFLPPLPKFGCPIFLEIRNPLGKVMERTGLIFELFFPSKMDQIRRSKKRCFTDF